MSVYQRDSVVRRNAEIVDMAEYLDNLNAQQRDAVVYSGGHSLVIAGAGSGKTRVLTCKIMYLLDNGLTPDSIMALTFTNKAANEMKQRIAKLVGTEAASNIWMGTFHSVFLRVLRTHAQKIGLNSKFSIYEMSPPWFFTSSKNLL